MFQGRYKAILVEPQNEYFSTFASYIHLNPVRIKGFDFKTQKLVSHVWSSYSSYINLSKRIKWLSVDSVLNSEGLTDTSKGRQNYRAIIERKIIEVQNHSEPWNADSNWDKIRRGWCYGGDKFRETSIKMINKKIKLSKGASYSGTEVKLHNENEAMRLVKIGLKALKVKEEELSSMKKNCPEKYAVAWLIRSHTHVSPQWIKEKLHMGKATNFSQFLRKMTEGKFGINFYKMVKNIKS